MLRYKHAEAASLECSCILEPVHPRDLPRLRQGKLPRTCLYSQKRTNMQAVDISRARASRACISSQKPNHTRVAPSLELPVDPLERSRMLLPVTHTRKTAKHRAVTPIANSTAAHEPTSIFPKLVQPRRRLCPPHPCPRGSASLEHRHHLRQRAHHRLIPPHPLRRPRQRLFEPRTS